MSNLVLQGGRGALTRSTRPISDGNSPMSRTIRPILIVGKTAFITLTKGLIATIDAADVPLIEEFNWYARVSRSTTYAQRSTRIDGKRQVILMHRVIMDAPDGMQVDHISCDGLDNRRENMRLATRAQNSQNSRIRIDNKSGFKGVCWNKKCKKWSAQITVFNKGKHLGLFTTPESAHAAYVDAANRLFGEFARAG